MASPNEAQIDFWNGRAAEIWVAEQRALDEMLTPVTAALTARVGDVAGRRVLDVGCGTGQTCTIWLDAGATVTGVDVSAPMLALAAERTGGRATLVQADASTWRGDAPFDVAVSRFGVMFFAEPDVAFARIAANVRPGGRLVFVCWRAAKENAWVGVPMAAVKDPLPEGPPSDPLAPGPFAFADRDRVHGILERAGFTSIAIDAFDFDACLAPAGGVDAAVAFVSKVGPTARALFEATDDVRAAAGARLRAALAPHTRDGRVALGGACWIVEAVRAAG